MTTETPSSQSLTLTPSNPPLSPSFGNQFLTPFNQPSPSSQQQKPLKITLKTMIQQALPKGCCPSPIPKKKKRKHSTRLTHLLLKHKPTSQTLPTQQAETSLEALEKLRQRLEQRREQISFKKMKREAHLKEMREINKNYDQFYKQFKRTKPLYEIKEEEYRKMEEREIKMKRERALGKLRDMYRPLDMKGIKEHEKTYLQSKGKVEVEKEQQEIEVEDSLSQNKNKNKRYYRGKSHDIILEEFRVFKDKYKQKEYEGVIKMKEYCENVVSKIKGKMVENQRKRREKEQVQQEIELVNNSQDISRVRELSKKRQRSYTEPDKLLLPQPTPTPSNLSPVYQTINPQSSQPSPVSSPNKRPSVKYHTLSNSPVRKLKIIKDRYDLQQLIYENERRDIRISQNQQLAKYGKKPRMEQEIRLEDDYIESIKQKINILAAKC